MTRLPTLCLLIVLAVVLAACRQSVGGATPTAPGAAPAFSISTAFEPQPPAAGPGAVVVTVQSPDGQPLAGATVDVRADMNHAGMTPEIATASETDSPGVYRAAITWSMGGDWIVEVRVTLPDGATATAQATVRVES